MGSRLLPTFGLVKNLRISFYALDERTKGIRAFISASRANTLLATNPKIIIDTDLARKPVEPTMVVTFINDKVLTIPAANMSVNQMLEEITRQSNVLSREGLKSEREIQYLKDIDN